MKIKADIIITSFNEEDKKKIMKLFRSSRGGYDPIQSSEIFPPLVRFYNDLESFTSFLKVDDKITFTIIGCVMNNE